MDLKILRYQLILCTYLWLCSFSHVYSQTIQTMLVRTDIRFRYATTEVTCVMSNDENMARELEFEFTLPKEAYISNFTMEIEGKEYPGHVKEKAAAREQYNTALQSGSSGGLVQQSVRHSNKFDVLVNIAAGSSVTFHLMYEELLRRRFGRYEHAVYINPTAFNIRDFTLEVFIQDRNEIINLRTPEMRNDIISNAVEERNNLLTVISHPSPLTAHVQYRPSPAELQQKGQGWFVVQYDVNATHAGGELLVVDGFFVHFFVPDDDLPPLPLDIVFVLDISGSMHGTKIRQLRDAMAVILGDLTEKDRFNILLFDDRIESWRGQLQVTNSDNIKSAQTYVKNIQESGSTDINQALLRGLASLRDSGFQSGRVPMLFFLTDGQPTSGLTNLEEILKSVKSRNEGVVSIYSLAFGTGADYQFLQKLSAQNKGFARKIYEASDAAAQVTGLYGEISAVVLSNLTVTYHATSSKDDGKDDVKNDVIPVDVTRTSQPTVFRKFDFCATGRFDRYPRKWTLPYLTSTVTYTNSTVPYSNSTVPYDNSRVPTESGMTLIVSGQSANGQVNLILTESSLDELTLKGDNPFWTVSRDLGQMTERVWAFLTIKQLLEQRLGSGDNSAMEARILRLSLEYNFVTPLTSMVVTRPQDVSTPAEAQASFVEDGDVKDLLPRRALSGQRTPAHYQNLLPRRAMSGQRTPGQYQNLMPSRNHFSGGSAPGKPYVQYLMHGRKTYPRWSLSGQQDLQNFGGSLGIADLSQSGILPPHLLQTVLKTLPVVKPIVPTTLPVVRPTCAKNQEVKLKYISGTLETVSQSRSICLELPQKGKRQGGNYTIFTTDSVDPSNRKGCKKGKKCPLAEPMSSNLTQSVTVPLQGHKLTSSVLVVLKGAPVSVTVDEEGRLVLEELGQAQSAGVPTPGYSANASGDGRSVVLQQEELTVTVRVLESDCKETVVTVDVRLQSPAQDARGKSPWGVLGPFFKSQDAGLTSTERPAGKGKRGSKWRVLPGKGKRSEYGSRVSQDCLAAGFPPEASHALTQYLLKRLASV